jgi:regulatory protein
MAALKISLKSRALRYLSNREHSRLELARKLARYADEGDDINALLDFLEAEKFLSQTRFSESLVHRRVARFGNNRILSELHSHGIEADALGDITTTLNQDERARARDVLRKRFALPPVDMAERAKRMRFLQQRGFSQGAIQAAMRDSPDERED